MKVLNTFIGEMDTRIRTHRMKRRVRKFLKEHAKAEAALFVPHWVNQN